MGDRYGSGARRRHGKASGGNRYMSKDQTGASLLYTKEESDRTSKMMERRRENARDNALDEKFLFERHSEGPDRVGWMFNMCVTSLVDGEGNDQSAMDFYFVEEDGSC